MSNQQLKNAIAIVNQMHNGEWEFSGHFYNGKFNCFEATRNGITLWLASGGWFCSVKGEPWQLGHLGGWIVWLFAGRKYAREMERKMKKQPKDLTF